MKIILDMDGTTVNYIKAAVKIANKMWNIDLKEEEITHYKFADFVLEKLNQKMEPKEIYKRIMLFGDPDFYEELFPYEDTLQTIYSLASKDHEIIFLTKLVQPYEICMRGKVKWLYNHLKEINYNVIFVTKAESKKYVLGDFFVDDDPRSLLSYTPGINRTPICIERPWNKDFREEHNEICSIRTLSQLPAIIDNIKEVKRLTK